MKCAHSFLPPDCEMIVMILRYRCVPLIVPKMIGIYSFRRRSRELRILRLHLLWPVYTYTAKELLLCMRLALTEILARNFSFLSHICSPRFVHSVRTVCLLPMFTYMHCHMIKYCEKTSMAVYSSTLLGPLARSFAR